MLSEMLGVPSTHFRKGRRLLKALQSGGMKGWEVCGRVRICFETGHTV